MKTKYLRPFRAVSLALGLVFLSITASPVPLSAAIASRTKLEETEPKQPIQDLTLANGRKIRAAFESYSLQSRIITLRSPDGKIGYLAPRELTAVSKLKWLASPAFLSAFQTYHPPNNAIVTIVKVVSGPIIACLLGAFLAFWLAVAFVSGHRRLSRASRTYAHGAVFAFIVGTATLIINYGVAKTLGNSPIAPMIHTTVIVVAVFTAVSRISCLIANDYGISGGSGLGTVMLSFGFSLLLATISLYLLPRFLQYPGIDDWFTDRLLAPLGLA